MKTVLIGADFMYNKDGKLIPIEINTNLTLNQKYINEEDIFNLSDLHIFVQSNKFTKITYIGRLLQFDKVLESFCKSNNIEYQFILTSENAVTLPFIEDTDEHLIIRSAYDTTAVIDEKYCRDKIEFNKLVSLPIAYKTNKGEFISTIKELLDNGTYPNYIIKTALPSPDNTEYPKLLKIDNLDDIKKILNKLPSGFYISPFYFNKNKLHKKNIQILRSFDILYLPELKAINVGSTRKFYLKNTDIEQNIYLVNYKRKIQADLTEREKIVMNEYCNTIGSLIILKHS